MMLQYGRDYITVSWQPKSDGGAPITGYAVLAYDVDKTYASLIGTTETKYL